MEELLLCQTLASSILYQCTHLYYHSLSISLPSHVLLAPSSLNGYVWDTFPGLRDLLRASQDDQAIDNTTSIDSLLQQHVAALTHHLTLASQALTFSPW